MFPNNTMSSNPNITWEHVEANPDIPWNYNFLSGNPMGKHPFFDRGISYVLKGGKRRRTSKRRTCKRRTCKRSNKHGRRRRTNKKRLFK